MIHAPNINTLWTNKRLKVHGDVDIKVYDPEDLIRMEPKVDILDTNVVKDDLLEKLNDEMHTTASTNTAHQLHTGTNWHPASDMCYSPDLCDGYTIVSNREGENGISVAVTGYTGTIEDDVYGGCTQCKGFCLYDNTSTSTTNNASTWAAEATWLSGYDPNTTTVERMYMGKDFDSQIGGNFTNVFSTSFDGPYNFKYAYYDNTNFTIQTLDILRVTWTITVG